MVVTEITGYIRDPLGVSRGIGLFSAKRFIFCTIRVMIILWEKLKLVMGKRKVEWRGEVGKRSATNSDTISREALKKSYLAKHAKTELFKIVTLEFYGGF